MSSGRFRWSLVDGFVNIFNDHREAMVTPAEVICIDESMYRWYGMGDRWINTCLPIYIAIDRKSENGYKIQNSACGKSSIVLRLNLAQEAGAE